MMEKPEMTLTEYYSIKILAALIEAGACPIDDADMQALSDRAVNIARSLIRSAAPKEPGSDQW